jgi:hypothetical protein
MALMSLADMGASSQYDWALPPGENDTEGGPCNVVCASIRSAAPGRSLWIAAPCRHPPGRT